MWYYPWTGVIASASEKACAGNNHTLILITIMMNKIVLAIFITACAGCRGPVETNKEYKPMLKLITLDPGHFHAALVQKSMYDLVDSNVHVYAPGGNDLQLHLQRIEAYNKRADSPTRWNEQVYAGDDYLEKMLAEKQGNVVVLAGNNQKKTDYILRSLQGGFNVLSDKPMAINPANFELLKQAFDTARQRGLLLYDIMTERFEITSILQRELSLLPGVFGTLEQGTEANPAVVIESGHCFYKKISGNVLTRPAWFMDVAQQGEGIVDVTTHLVDLVQWQCFPGQTLDYRKDVQVLAARRWPTNMRMSEFRAITKLDSFPSYLHNTLLNDTTLQVYSNGSISYRLRGVHAKVAVEWNYLANDGHDTHYAIMRGTRASLVIRQGQEQGYQPALYIEPRNDDPGYERTVLSQVGQLSQRYPGLALKKLKTGWELIIPGKYREGHEAHFARVTSNFLEYLQEHNLPEWEVPGMLAKYYTTVKALEMARKN